MGFNIFILLNGKEVVNFKLYAAVGLISAAIFAHCRKAGNLEPDAQFVKDSTGVPLKNMFGVNAYEWNFLQDPNNPNDVSKIYEPKMAAIKNFTAVRHYMDWEKIEPQQGKYTFNPTHSGSWNYDAIYERAKQDSILMLADLKSCPPWFLNAYYPADMRDAEDVPAPYGSDRKDPASYVAQAKAAFQFVARYGSNANVDRSLVTVDPTPRWTNDPVNQVKIGLKLVKYIECDNERDKWWKGPKAQQSAEEYAANLSAFYDGNKGKLGKNAGVKNADPSMQVVMGGLSVPDVQYVKDMIAWCKTNRGTKADGSVDLCWDVINYHYYNNDGDPISKKQSATGIAPELSMAGTLANNFVQLANAQANHMPVWITESGYDINPGSTQKAPAIGSKSALLTQGDWIIRTCLMYMRHGISRLFFYQLFDDTPNSGGTYATSGLVNDNPFNRRPAADYIKQVNALMGNYTYKSTISTDPLVDKYVSGGKTIYALMIPDQKGRTGTYTLDLGTSASANIYNLKAGADAMTVTNLKTNGGKLTVTVTETPVFVRVD